MTTRAHLLRILHRAAWTASVAVTALCWLVLGFEVYVRLGSISPRALDGFAQSVRFTDRDGVVLREVVGSGGERAQWRSLDQISPLLQDATIAVEDARFFEHDGIDAVGVMRALHDNVRAGRVVSGASTLSMQLARLIEPSPKNVIGKLGEMVRARRLERALDKSAILEQYLNRAPYGGGIIGVQAASLRYFGKDNLHLGLAEAALIAGLPKAPSQLDPRRNPAGAKARQKKVLERMLATGRISRTDHERALAEPLIYKSAPPALAAMHFTDYALARLEQADARVRGTVRTTLDHDLQRAVEGAVHNHVRALAAGNLGNAAVVVLDNRRCEVRVMVGSADYWDEAGHGAVNGALARRQPGSTLKPFTYALALEEHGLTPASVIADVATEYGEVDGTLFRPKNFSGKFSGPVLLGDALGRSLNVPAIKVAAIVGVAPLLERLRALGMRSLTRSAEHYGLGLTLGNGEVTPLELAQAYAALARGGLACAEVEVFAGDAESRPDPGGADPGARVFSARTSFLITEILGDERLRIAAFGPANALLLGFPIAVKTGTSSNWRDSWAVGYTERYTIAVWAGNFDGSSMNHLAGATGAGPLFATVAGLVMERAERRGEPPAHGPTAPDGVVEVEVCALSGKRPSEHCPHRRRVHTLAEHRPDETCDFHQSIAVDLRTQLRAGPLCPGEFVQERVFEVLPPEYAGWQADSRAEVAPAAYSSLCPLDGPIPGSVVITYPRDGEVFLIEPGFARDTQSVRMSALVSGAVDAVTWTVDDRRVAVADWPYDAHWPLAPGRHTLEVSAPGQRGHRVAFDVIE